MYRILTITTAAVLLLTGCGGTSKADAAACKSAMDTSSTGIVQWSQDKSTRPAACQKLSDDEFNKVSAEWYEEFNKKMQEAVGK